MKRLLVALVLCTTGCGSAQVCGLVGCAGRAELRLHDVSPALAYPLTVHACLDARCADLTVPQQPPAVGEPVSVPCAGSGPHSCADVRSAQGYVGIAFADPPAGTHVHAASLVVRDAAGTVVVDASRQLRLAELAPNGEACGPICWSGVADFTGWV